MTVESPQRPKTRQPDPKYMTFVEHLQELRHRLVVCLAAVAVGSVGGWFLSPRAIHLIDEPLRKSLGKDGQLIANTVYGGFTLQLKIAIIIGFLFALPITIYQLWGFLAPAFGPGANKWAPVWMTSAIVLFVAGATTGYFVIPLAVQFFSHFQSADVKILPFASEYVGFIALILIVFGVSFELPLAIVSLAAVGMTSSKWLRAKRLHAFFGCFIFSTIATPGADLVSPLILGAILYILFEVSVVVTRLMGK